MDEKEDIRQFNLIEGINAMKVFIELVYLGAYANVSSISIKGITYEIKKHGILVGMEMIKNDFGAVKKVLIIDSGKTTLCTDHNIVKMRPDIVFGYRIPVGKKGVDLPQNIIYKLMLINGHSHLERT